MRTGTHVPARSRRAATRRPHPHDDRRRRRPEDTTGAWDGEAARNEGRDSFANHGGSCADATGDFAPCFATDLSTERRQDARRSYPQKPLTGATKTAREAPRPHRGDRTAYKLNFHLRITADRERTRSALSRPDSRRIATSGPKRPPPGTPGGAFALCLSTNGDTPPKSASRRAAERPRSAHTLRRSGDAGPFQSDPGRQAPLRRRP